MSARARPPRPPEPGVALDLARRRARQISGLLYSLDLAIAPAADRLAGRLCVDFDWAPPRSRDDVLLDYRPPPGALIGRLHINGVPMRATRPVHEHLRLPQALLVRGPNRIELDLVAPIAAAGTGLTRFEDPADGARYVYSLLVPSDASTVFPCFDQPDLKARFALSLTVPADWTAVGNGRLLESAATGGRRRRRLRFAPSEPISSYLFAFAAGPFVALAGDDPAVSTRLWVRRSQRRLGARNAAEVLRLDAAAVTLYSDWLATPFPFAKYDLVAVPEFAYRGMEHAGASFLREDQILLGPRPTTAALVDRAQLLFHETAHQWMGNLVTMRWFDDLWLKEGFANFLAGLAADRIVPELPAAIAFHALKTTGVRTDASAGTMPLHQPLDNLAAAKSAYGPIVYAKAPAVLQQAQALLGERVFRDAVRAFVRRHAWGAAGWRDLVGALERAHGRALHRWARAWILRTGQPVVRPRIDLDARGRIREASLEQHTTEGRPGRWPLRVQIFVAWPGGRTAALPVELQRASTAIPALRGRPAPCFVFANHRDLGSGVFLLDAASRRHALDHLSDLPDALLRAQVWESLGWSVRRTELAPEALVAAILRHLPRETDELVAAGTLAHLRTLCQRYLTTAHRTRIGPALEALLRENVLAPSHPSLRPAWVRACAALASEEATCSVLADLADGRTVRGQPAPSPADRACAALALVALGHSGAMPRLRRLARTLPPDEARRLVFVARAAVPDAASKRAVLHAWLHEPGVPERWIDAGLEWLNDPRHAGLTAPLLRPALLALPRLRRTQKIFFVDRWLAAFLGGQDDARALCVAKAFLQDRRLAPDVRRKLAEVVDELAIVVRARAACSGA